MEMEDIRAMQRRFFPDLPFDERLYHKKKVTPCMLQKFFLVHPDGQLLESELEDIIKTYTRELKNSYYM